MWAFIGLSWSMYYCVESHEERSFVRVNLFKDGDCVKFDPSMELLEV